MTVSPSRMFGAAVLAACLSLPAAADAGGFISIGFGRPAYTGYYGGGFGHGYYGGGYYGGYGRPAYTPVVAPVAYAPVYQPAYYQPVHTYTYARPVYTPPVRTVSYGYAPAYRHSYYGGGFGSRAYVSDVDINRRGSEIEYTVIGPNGRDYEIEYEYDRFGRLRDIDIDD